MTNIISTNPSENYNPLGFIESTPESDIPLIIQNARKAHRVWKNTPLNERIFFLREIYDTFVQQKEILAQSVATEMGMPIKLARDEVQYGLNYFLWYLDNAGRYLATEVVFESETELHTVHYESKGVIAAITPWNYPVMLCIWACVQPLLAGNVVVWKISKEVILTGKLIGDILKQSSLPSGVWTEIYGDGKMGDILTDQDIDGITFTGSTNVGKSLARKAFEKGIPALMELGGSAPGIVCEDADIDSVLETIYFMRFSNSGQMCDGLKRLMVHASRYDELVQKLGEKLQSKKLGNAIQEDIDIGPLVSESQLRNITEQYEDAMKKGAVIESELIVSEKLSGAYFAPTILGNISRDMHVWKEEVFGPILPILTFSTLEEAVELANDTTYGLGAYVFTENKETFLYLAERIDSGMVQQNNVNYCIPSDPFGGYKASGTGREHGKWGFHEFCNVKVTSIPKK
ncbi:aldehyde dehydrogenase [Candidatus Gracilibacteria bacterium]|nr:aldehyde dehydrogenase [Candidatus Gracilibacteria bacterium]